MTSRELFSANDITAHSVAITILLHGGIETYLLLSALKVMLPGTWHPPAFFFLPSRDLLFFFYRSIIRDIVLCVLLQCTLNEWKFKYHRNSDVDKHILSSLLKLKRQEKCFLDVP